MSSVTWPMRLRSLSGTSSGDMGVANISKRVFAITGSALAYLLATNLTTSFTTVFGTEALTLYMDI